MKKRMKFSKNHPIHKRHHHIKLAALITSKIAIALLSFSIGIYVGSYVHNTFVAILIACGLAAFMYLASVLHIVDWLNIP